MKKIFSFIIALLIMIVPIAGCQQESGGGDEASLTLDKKSVSIQVLGEAEIIADYSNLGDDLTWTNSDSSVVSMQEYGNYVKVKAIQPGFSIITAKSGKLTASCTVIAGENDYVFSLVVDRVGDVELQKGGSIFVPARTIYGTQEIENASINYSIADTTIAKVQDGVVTGLKAGETTLAIYGEYNGLRTPTSYVNVIIKDGPALVLSMSQLSLYEHDATASQTYYPSSSNLSVYIVDDGKKVNNIEYTIDNTDDGVATINSSGKISSGEAGSTTFTITCEYKGQSYSGYLFVEVAKVPLLEISINTSKATLFSDTLSTKALNSISLISTVKYDGRTMVGDVKYSVISGINAASVNDSGVIRARAPGKAVVQASFTYKGKTVNATCNVTVKDDLSFGGEVSETLGITANNAIFAYLSSDYNTLQINNVNLTDSHDQDVVRLMTLNYDGVTPDIYRLFIRLTDVNDANNWVEVIYSHHNSGHSLANHGTNGVNLYAMNTSAWTLPKDVVGFTNYRPNAIDKTTGLPKGNNVTILKSSGSYSGCSGSPSEWLNLRMRDPQTAEDYTKYMIGVSVVNDEASLNSNAANASRINWIVFSKQAQEEVLVNDATYANPVWSGFTSKGVTKVNVTIKAQFNSGTTLSGILIDTLGGQSLTSDVMNSVSLTYVQ